MGIAPLPRCNMALLKSRLYDEYQIEVPLTQLYNRQLIRISIQAYNTPEDVNALVDALNVLLPQVVD
jgi:isopenicillin-N epimerase